MANLSNYLEKKLLDHANGVLAFTMPTALYLALSTADPTDDGSGLTEPTGAGYARQPLAMNAADVNNASGNSTDVTFTASGGNWGTITHVAIFDAATGGNMLWHGPMAAAKTINDGDSLTFRAGDIILSLD